MGRVRRAGGGAGARTGFDDQVSEHVLVPLADPIRREVLAILAREGGTTSTSLAAGLPITRQAVAKHLAVLDRAGLVRAHRAGREVRYEADLQPLKQTTVDGHSPPSGNTASTPSRPWRKAPLSPESRSHVTNPSHGAVSSSR
ncbi:metalloregulator ArsR/SmtB family transcription factor [Streptomyces sp. NPDC000658]|uniref:ArsR/SmtB family transcription factor n=1 Tax=Streptomyces sp. NPDC000658 TaxID=3154266 RepID=UPI0033319F4D